MEKKSCDSFYRPHKNSIYYHNKHPEHQAQSSSTQPVFFFFNHPFCSFTIKSNSTQKVKRSIAFSAVIIPALLAAADGDIHGVTGGQAVHCYSNARMKWNVFYSHGK